jgi:hypothetical protein
MSELYEALLEVQREIKPVKKTSANPFFKSKYADLEAVVEAVMPILTKNGVVCVQTTGIKDGLPILTTRLVHAKTAQEISEDFPIISKDMTDPQKVIAGLTYMRRACLTTICGLATQDDDGNTASGNDSKPVTQYKTPLPAKPAMVKESSGAKKIETFVSCSRDTEKECFILKSTKGDVYYTTKEVLARMVRDNFGKPLPIDMTVNNEMQKILLEVNI